MNTLAPSLIAFLGVMIVLAASTVTEGFKWASRQRLERKVALRLLVIEFEKVIAVARPVCVTGAPGPEFDQFPSTVFREQATTLARALDMDMWKLVSGAGLGAERLEGLRQEIERTARGITFSERRDEFLRICLHVEETINKLSKKFPQHLPKPPKRRGIPEFWWN